MTGIDDPYEAPTNADITIDAEKIAVADAVETIVAHLYKNGFLKKIE